MELDRYESDMAHQIHLEELNEMEMIVPMTLIERQRLRRWVYSGHGVDSNPWHYKDEGGYEMNYLDAYHRNLAETWGEFYRPCYLVVPNL